jgi:PKD repeat protein
MALPFGILAAALAVAAPAAQATPSVSLQVSAGTVRVGQDVGFTATASTDDGAAISSVTWTFGDGATGSGASVSHSYGATGTYTVTVTATDANGLTATDSGSVRVVGNPAAAFSFAPNVPNIGDAVAFDGSGSSDPGGAISSYAWNFGDGSTGSGARPSHGYATSGDKTVTLTITAALDGRTATVSHTVHVNVPPTASFVFAAVNAPQGQDPFTPVLNQQVAFSAQASSDGDGTIRSYEWDLGSGTFGAPATVSWLVTSFPAAGNKDIRLRVTDDRGATGIATVRFRVNTPPTAAFDVAPAAPVTGDTVSFTSSASDADGVADLASTSWDLNGDGTYGDATGPTAKAVYLTAGTYTVGERVVDKGGAATTLTKQVAVKGPPAPPPTEQPSGSGTPPTVVPSPGAPVLTTVSPVSDNSPAKAASAGGATTGASGGTATVALKLLRGVRVQLAGSVTASRTKITRIVVTAPTGSLVVARCTGGKGKGCPAKALRQKVKTGGRVTLAVMQRTLRAGARIVVTVSKSGFATRRIVLTMRAGKAPARAETCLLPTADGTSKEGRCPEA